MNKISKYILFILLIGFQSNAQTPITIVKDSNYTVTGTETLTASESITLKPNTWIKAGSIFVAKIDSDAYRNNSFSNENYVFTRTFQTPLNNSSEINKNSDVVETITYFDGLGRPMQNIGIKASPTIQDIITYIAYDSIGRQKKEFLPYMDNSVNLASYRSNALTNTNNYYISNYSTEINNAKPNPYSEKDFEKSPLNRILKQAAPGFDWALENGHEIKLDYQTNQENEVKQYLVTSQIGSAMIGSKIYDSPYYASGLLNKKISKDENWTPTDGNNKTTHEFIDKEGHTVLKRTFGTSKVNGILSSVSHDTYYVYDEYGNLIVVIPPLVDTDLFFTSNQSTSGFDDFSKVFNQSVFSGTTSGGGSVTVTIVNNVLKVVFSGGYNSSFLSDIPQDLATTPCTLPNMNLGTISNGDYNVSIVNGKLKLTSITGAPSTQFSATFTVNLPTNCTAYQTAPDATILNNLCYQYKYDAKNRLVEKKLPGKDWEYIIYDKLDRPVLTQDANLRANNKWLFTKYDAFGRPAYTGEYVNTTDIIRTAVQSLADNSATVFENKKSSALNVNGKSLNYSNNVFPNSGIDLFTINYYDDYNNIDLDGGATASSYNITPITNAKGLATCSKVRVLGTADWITNTTYYDNKGRAIYNYNKNNFLNVVATIKTKLDFGGKALETTTTHIRTSVVPNVSIQIVDSFTYDHAGRLLNQKQTINNQQPELIVSNTYDNLGQLSTKGVGGKTTQARLQTVDYTYNIRGWLKNINNVNAIGSDLFAFQLNYNTPSTGTALFNGNISQTFWRTANVDNSLKNNTYSYDGLNRLTFATDNSTINAGRYNESLSYDKNGNITNLLRLGNRDANATQFGNMDILTYNYTGNKLEKVEDSSGSTEGFNNGVTLPIEYDYDANGNMKTDANKGITGITYNHLNLPTSVAITGGTIDYKYDATGVKQRKTISTGGTTDYAGNFVYENIVLKQFSQPEGYVTYNAGIFNYIYQYKDHLGNNRLSYQDKDNNGIVNDSEIVQENNYYAFGLAQKGYNGAINGVDNKFKYNGKELQDELGLNVYDYDNRIYDPAIGRFLQMDPLGERGRRWSPYNYCFDNPMYFRDPDGMWPTLPSWNDVKKTYNEAKGSVSRTYNQAKSTASRTYNETKATITKTYNETKKSVVETTNKAVASSKETLKEGQKWVKENKNQLITVAKEIQKVGDNTTTAGLVGAVAGAPVAGVGAAPGLTVAAAGGIVSGIGAGLEIGVNLISGDANEAAGGAAVYIAGELGGMAVDKAIPGPNPDATPLIKEAIQAGQEIVKNKASDATKEVAKKVRE